MDQEYTEMNMVERDNPLAEQAERGPEMEQSLLDSEQLQTEQIQSAPQQGSSADHNSPSINDLSKSELATAFNVFNRVSAQLDESYQRLEAQIAGINSSEVSADMAYKRETLSKDLAIKDHQIQRLNGLISVLPSGLVVLDKNSNVCEANHKAVELLGRPLIGMSWSGVIARIAVPEVRAGFELKLRDGRILSLTSRDLPNTSERLVLINEVTSIHEHQERVNRDKRLAALGEMAASLAHQIRTPLSSAMLYMSQLSLSKLPEASRAPMANKVQTRLAHMSSLIDSMLSFVRGAKPDTRTISLSSLIEKTEQLVRSPAHQAGASVKFTEVDSSLMLHADIAALAGALANLVLNAIEMNPGNPWVCVEASALNQNQIQIRVSDNGPGISSQHIDKIFDPFFTTRAHGTGLGLAVVATTVAAHGGDVRARNRDAGGAEFIIRLPALDTMSSIGNIRLTACVDAHRTAREVA